MVVGRLWKVSGFSDIALDKLLITQEKTIEGLSLKLCLLSRVAIEHLLQMQEITIFYDVHS